MEHDVSPERVPREVAAARDICCRSKAPVDADEEALGTGKDEGEIEGYIEGSQKNTSSSWPL
jgi:hypothetical protein